MLSVIFFFIIIGSLYLYSTRTYGYWKQRFVKHDRPVPLLGTNAKGFFMQRSMTQLASDMYWKYPDESVVGFFRSSTPELIIRDPNLVKCILLNDFVSFSERGVTSHQECAQDPLAAHLFSADGDLWRLLRQRLTPAFTSSKLKAMSPLIEERVKILHERIQAASGAPIDAKDIMARFFTDCTGAYGLGVEMDALSNDDSEYRKLGEKIILTGKIRVLKDLIRKTFPNIFGKNHLKKDYEEDVLSLFRSIFQQRNYEPSGRNDFIDLLLESKRQGVIVCESVKKNPDGTPKQTKFEMTEDLMAAQAFLFFAAGFEPTSSTTSFALHLLAYHPFIQKKVQKDIDRVLAEHDNRLSSDAIQDMTYVEWTIKESMRIIPPVGVLLRQCTRKYKFPNVNLTIDKGVKIMIPVQALQNDPHYFDNPEEFRPERFDPKELNVDKTKYVYLPFGGGLRSCIGIKLGLMMSMAGLAAVLSRYSVEPAASSIRYPCLESTPLIIQCIKGGLPLLFRERMEKQ